MATIFQSHFLSLRNDMYKLGFACVLGIGATTIYSMFVNRKLSFIINDNNFKHKLLVTKIEQLSNKISNLTYEREQLLDKIISFSPSNDDNSEITKSISNAIDETHNQNNTIDDDFAYGFYENIPCSNYGKETHNYSFGSLK
jgi:hypothetical protein